MFACAFLKSYCVFLFQVKSLVFDQSGTYLAVGGSDIRVYICKQWSEVLNFTGEQELLCFQMFIQYACCMAFAVFDPLFFIRL